MKLNEFQKLSQRTLNLTGDHKDNINQMLMGMSGETGEIVDIYKKHWYQGHDADLQHVVEEIGDVMFYVAGLCSVLGVDLDSCCKSNVGKLEKRYPNGFNQKDSVKRVDVSE